MFVIQINKIRNTEVISYEEIYNYHPRIYHCFIYSSNSLRCNLYW